MAEFQTTTITITRTFTKGAAEVWQALTAGIIEWWPKDFYIGTYSGLEPVGVELEPTPGGRFVEHWGGGDGLLWGTVTTSNAPKHLALVGDLAPEYGGPSRAFTDYRLTAAEGGGTLLTFTHSPFGAISEDTIKSLTDGWNVLLDHLLRWVESGERPERPPSVIQAQG